MKLKPPRTFLPLRERLELMGDLHAYLADYARYYEAVHGMTIALPELLLEIARTFLRSDRAFWAWRREASAQPKSPRRGRATHAQKRPMRPSPLRAR
jgi:hypothetical protein